MHELSIAMSILDFAEEEAERRGGGIQAIHIKVGALSGVVKQALLSAYDLARENTPFTTCDLVVEETPIVIHCRDCDADRPVASVQAMRCPECGESAFEIIQGRELQVVGLELAS
jgi:hydrogenase nickel incorporation protein HypA/HybF